MPDDAPDPQPSSRLRPRGSRRPADFGSSSTEPDGPDDTGTDPDADAVEKADAPAHKEKRRAPLWLETIVLLAIALGMALVIKTFFVQAFYIPSESMEPGLVKNDRILVQKPSYWWNEPSRGDVIVFKDPGGWLNGAETGPQTYLARVLAKVGLYPTGGHLVKRVIGTPGDEIHCCDAEGKLEINGYAIDEDSFIREQPQCDGPMPNGCSNDWTVVVPDDRLFVMGDNRAASADSSDHLCGNRQNPKGCDRAFVPIDLVVGKVFALVWPADHFEFIGRPEVFDDVPDPQ